MKKFLAAIALTIALPGMALAQAAPAAPKAGCCEKMKDMAGCKDMAKMDMAKIDMAKMDHKKHDMKAGMASHAGHGMSKPTAKAPQADAHQNHK